ncbi:MAG: hypothetical protein M1837_005521 [Sclerophora amabilis]|nr:MAG: hypothetical protein M1837_005521 [Sclerophora amabilis]
MPPSSTPSSAPIPFGYAIETSDFNFPPPPPPPPSGAPLLDNSESKGLEDFFKNVSSTSFDDPSYDDPSFFKEAFSSLPDEHYAFISDAYEAAHYYGASSTMPQPTANLGSSDNSIEVSQDGGGQHFDHTSFEYPTPLSGDDLKAASALMQSGHPPSAVFANDTSHQGSFAPQQANSLYANTPNYGASLAQQNSIESSGTRTGHRSEYANPTPSRAPRYIPDFMNTRPPIYPPADPAQSGFPSNLHWGSDQSFYNHGYVAPPHQETEEEVTNGLMDKMGCLVPQSSANNTRPSSPRQVEASDLRRRRKSGAMLATVKREEGGSSEEDVALPRHKKRRKSKYKEEDRDDMTDDDKKPTKSRRANPVHVGSTEQPRNRLRSGLSPRRVTAHSNAQRVGRENLSEDQKRSNHILSEQKRRNLIKQGFDDLCELVPELHGGGHSKSVMLFHAADWLEDLLLRMEELRGILASMGDGSEE